MNRIFRDLLSLHGYPLPFEATETIAERKAAAAYGPRYGRRAASRRGFGATGKAPRAELAGAACQLGACG